MPIKKARVSSVDLVATRNVFISAIRFATSSGNPCPLFGDELKTSAQEQVEYMLGEDEETPLITADEEVKSEVKTGLSKICSLFEKDLSSLLFESDLTSTTAENRILGNLSDLEWMCKILPKLDLMKEFVSNWTEISSITLVVIQNDKLDSLLWGLKVKVKLIEVIAKVLDAVGYGSVILQAECRVKLLKTWLPFIRKMKALLLGNEETDFSYKIDEDLWQSIEGAIVSLVLALPSNDQAEILMEWMETEEVRYPDLSEAFEIWCYRTKSAKRRLVEGPLERDGNATVSL